MSQHEGLQVLHVDVEDGDGVDISRHFTKVNRFIHSSWLKMRRSTSYNHNHHVKEQGESGAILVHCMAGQSRSVALVLAYLGQKHKMSYEGALDCLRRAGVYLGELNDGFDAQVEARIKLWERRRKVIREDVNDDEV